MPLLHERPDQRQLLVDDPDLIPDAVEELLQRIVVVLVLPARSEVKQVVRLDGAVESAVVGLPHRSNQSIPSLTRSNFNA